MMKNIMLGIMILLITLPNAYAEQHELNVRDKIAIVEVMNKYALGIDSKNYDLYKSIFIKNVEVKLLYDKGLLNENEVIIKGANNWVDYVEVAISRYRNTQHMLGNPLISYENEIAKVRTDLQALHYYKEFPNRYRIVWGYYITHMKKENNEWKIIKHSLTTIGARIEESG
ncbi:MAG: hypothetical protein CML87_04810 [Rhodobiaceae bacterium]|jgi:hypothetical protein|nr:hypothetical protein [Rhodobiaceae bacterium]